MVAVDFGIAKALMPSRGGLALSGYLDNQSCKSNQHRCI